jgi:hypothetical protein
MLKVTSSGTVNAKRLESQIILKYLGASTSKGLITIAKIGKSHLSWLGSGTKQM